MSLLGGKKSLLYYPSADAAVHTAQHLDDANLAYERGHHGHMESPEAALQRVCSHPGSALHPDFAEPCATWGGHIEVSGMSQPQEHAHFRKRMTNRVKENYSSGEHVSIGDGLLVPGTDGRNRQYMRAVRLDVPTGQSSGTQLLTRPNSAATYRIPMAWARTRRDKPDHPGYSFGTLIALAGDVFWVVDQISSYRPGVNGDLSQPQLDAATVGGYCGTAGGLIRAGDAHARAKCAFLRAFYTLYKPTDPTTDKWGLHFGGVSGDAAVSGPNGDASILADNASLLFQHEINILRHNLSTPQGAAGGNSVKGKWYDSDLDYTNLMLSNGEGATSDANAWNQWKGPQCFSNQPGVGSKYITAGQESMCASNGDGYVPGYYSSTTSAAIRSQAGDYGGSKYIRLAAANDDHFSADAWYTYGIGHSLALKQAQLARAIQDPAARLEGWHKAIAIEAFSNHFLTDLFAGGHFTNPARVVRKWGGAPGGLLVKAMHDEGNAYGVPAENEAGDRWVSYGDGSFGSPDFAPGRAVLNQAIQASVDEITAMFTAGTWPSRPGVTGGTSGENAPHGVYAAYQKIPRPGRWNSGLTRGGGPAETRYLDNLETNTHGGGIGTTVWENHWSCNAPDDCTDIGPPSMWENVGTRECSFAGHKRVCKRIGLDTPQTPLFTMSVNEGPGVAMARSAGLSPAFAANYHQGGVGQIWRRGNGYLEGKPRTTTGQMTEAGSVAAAMAIYNPTGEGTGDGLAAGAPIFNPQDYRIDTYPRAR